VMALRLQRAETRRGDDAPAGDPLGMLALIPLPAQVERFIRLPAGPDDHSPIRFMLLETRHSVSTGGFFEPPPK